MIMDNKTLIEIDAKDLASPKIDKLQGKMKDTAKSTGLLSTAFGDLTTKAESMGIPVSNVQKYIGALGAGGIAAGAAAGLGAIAIGMGALSFSTIQSTADLKDFADQTGLSVEQITSMDLALKTSNVTTEQYADAMTKLTMNLVKNSKEFKKLGISTTDPQKAFEQLRKKISETEDPIERARLGNLGYSKTFKDLMPLMRMTEQEFQNLKKSSNVISTEDAEKAAELADKFDIMKASIGGAATNIGLSMMPAMESLFKLMEKLIPVITGTLSVFGKISDVIIRLSTSIVTSIGSAFKPLFDYLEKIWNKANDVLGLSDKVKEKETYRTQEFVDTRSKMQSNLTPEQRRMMGFSDTTNEDILSGWEPKVDKSTTSDDIKKTSEEAQRASLQKIIDAETAKIRKAEFDAMVSSRFSNLPGYEQKLNIDTIGSKDSTLKAKMEYNAASESKFESIEPQTVYDMTPEETAQWIAENSEARKEAIKIAQEEERKAEDDHLTRMKDLRISYANQIANTMSGPFETLFKEMTRGEIKFQNFFDSILENFGNMLVQMAAQMAAKAAIFGLLSLFTGGAASGLIGGFSTFMGFAANGSDYLPAGYTMVGERGPEIIYNDKPGAKVMSNNDVKQLGRQQMNITNNFNVREVKAKDVVEQLDSYNRRYGRYGLTMVGA